MSDKKRKYPWNKSRNRDGGAENEVYAGPEYFERQLQPVEPEESDPSVMEGVYAGPPMMCVYAGPEYFSGRDSRPAPGAFAPVPGDSLFCAVCGTPLQKGFKFCPGCGAAPEAEEE